ncbi:beta-ketoacyl synthase N-terminal-like domain-containing protein [Geobacter sp. DSM 9736]|uniref:beta-ketoacyl synthase N-terminal-like domain-containing protein n=1 Tax=Geobacter sp. DSM 9736 TaxID=1277350 RepID=UPI000B512CCD|nr:beta-ketoacyl synthase N-terminal-like domain-containing protein [Geobacter sp. DSM 9736]SNB47648.1 Beta-ketoacyl synthase, N-terminal domain [Geobacter sp. DSM 9736]
MKERYDIVVTGVSAITPAGIGIGPLRTALVEQRSHLQPVPPDFAGGEGHLWGRAEGFKGSDYLPPLKARRFDRGSLFAIVSAGMALRDARIDTSAVNAERIGIALGCGFGGIANSVEFLSGYFDKGSSGLVPMLFPNTVPNAPASNVSIEHGLKGPNITQVQRFCSTESAFQMACRFLREGRADVMLAGGVDDLNPSIIDGFRSAGQLCSWGNGFGEGCGMLVLERLDYAEKRGARPIAAIGGIRTVGRLLPGREKEGLEKLCSNNVPGLVSFSGTAGLMEEFRERFPGIPAIDVAPVIGRSLAMGGTSLAFLAASLEPEQRGLHLAASPEGPYFAIETMGVAPVRS